MVVPMTRCLVLTRHLSTDDLLLASRALATQRMEDTQLPGDGHHISRRWEDVSTLPTNGTQQSAIAIVILFTTLAFVSWGLRMVSRVQTKQFGVGMSPKLT